VKLLQEYWLVDASDKRVLIISDDFSEEHVRLMYYSYSIIYKNRGPLKIMAVDALGGQREVQLDSLGHLQ
jgi:Tol biopolymer transport system component